MLFRAVCLCAIGLLSWSSNIKAQDLDWSSFSIPDSVFLTAVAASPTRLVAIGFEGEPEFGAGVAFTSTSGSDWQPLDVGHETQQLQEVVYLRDRWLISRSDGLLHQSFDGIEWSVISIPEALRSRWFSIVELNGEVVLVGTPGLFLQGPSVRVIASKDLLNWQLRYERTDDNDLGGPFFLQTVSSGSELVSVVFTFEGSFTRRRSWTSFDGEKWQEGDQALEDVIWFDDRFLGIALWDGKTNPIGQRLQGGDWDFPAFQTDAERKFQVLARNGTRLIMSSGAQEPRLVLSSDLGQTWAPANLSTVDAQAYVGSLIAWRGGWVGVGNGVILGAPIALRSVPALSWQSFIVLVFGVFLASLSFVRRRFIDASESD